MEKILKKYTTIPEQLYVTRNADNQLKMIIDEMQRPGYVLVARQMGKTNLLFNAKRTLENENRLFVYVDLSNLFDNEKDCYRNIIDNIIEPNIKLFESIEGEIEAIRTKNLQPHNEYSRSLRAVLTCYSGDIVIVLDEIDALKSVEYSDNIFAQIRSNYFSRTNFPEFERLTYVLSGVIEPTELIKDRNKSPFNIGDKIYLDDFTKEEHEDFMKKSGLEISQEISDQIFDWAKGNPRITFDVCSELENYILNGLEVNQDSLESIVNKKYLTTYDIAPVDHIRELVKTNKQIRKAVNLINKNQTSELSDEIKRKLYLYGIIDSRFGKETKVKNKIIEKSLSEEWIKSVEKLSTDNYNYGLEKIDSKDYKEAISSLLEFLDNSNPSKLQIEICNYNIGFAYYKIGDYVNAINYFSIEFSQELYKANSLSLLGICTIGVGKVEEGRKILEKVIDEKINDYSYRNALLNLAGHLPKEDNERALMLYDLLYKSTFDSKDDISTSELNQLRTLSLFYQSELHLTNSNETEALNKVNEALKFSELSDSLFLIYYKYHLEAEKDESLKVILVDKIISNKLDFDTENSYPISFSENLLYAYLDFVFDSSKLELFEKLLGYSSENILLNINRHEIIYKVILKSSEKRLDILNYLLQFEDNCETDFLINVYWEVAFHNSNNKKRYFEAFDKYLNLFTITDRIHSNDVYLFAQTVKFRYDTENFFESIKLCQIIEPRLSDIEDENLKLESTIIYFWLALSYFTIKDRINARIYADKALDIISKRNKKTTSILDESGLLEISEQLRQIKYSSTINQPIINKKKYGKNEKVKVKYSDGKEVENKYKKLEIDILAKRCVIIQ